MQEPENSELTIDQDFKDLIRPLRSQEYLQLEENLLADGCREPIVVWNGVIVDGHNRYEICKKHGMDLTDKRIKIVKGWSARKLAELPGTGMSEEQAKALEEELNAANL